jgi:para-nitrobenzyl esterase
MMNAFVAFARNGDPDSKAAPEWPRYRLPERTTMVFDSLSRAEEDPRRWERELFARAPYIQPGS